MDTMKLTQSLLLTIAFGLGLAAWPVYATEYLIVLDLALSAGERTEPAEPGDYGFEIINRVPQMAYKIKVEKRVQAIKGLEPPSGPGGQGEDEPCPLISSIDKQLSEAREETEVARLAQEARRLIAKGECQATAVVELLRERLDQTRERLGGKYQLAEGESIQITISRIDGEEIKEWIFTFAAPSRGSWFTSYGFVFLGDRDETFFSKDAGGGKFAITRERSSGGELSNLSFAPSFFYTWLPRSDENEDRSPGFTVGLGFDQSNPVLFAGGSLNYNRFVSLISGVAIHKQKRLSGQYHPGQLLTESLSAEALHEEGFGVNYFLGLSFRFSSSPFGKDDDRPAEPVSTGN